MEYSYSCLVSQLENHSVNIQIITIINKSHFIYTEIFFLCKTGTTPFAGNLLLNIQLVLRVIFDSSMSKYLEANLVSLKQVICFSFIMMKCLTSANIFLCRLSLSFKGLACSKHRVKLYTCNELDNHTT